MGLMNALKGLFGGGSAAGGATAEPVEHGDYTITPAPQQTASGWNTAGTISKSFGEETKVHHFIRVDSHGNRDEAIAFSVTKAKQIIDQLGDRLFDQEH